MFSLREDDRDFFVYLFIYFLLTAVNFHLTAIFKFQKNELGHGPSLGDPTLKSNRGFHCSHE